MRIRPARDGCSAIVGLLGAAMLTSVKAATTATMGFATNAVANQNQPAALACPAGMYLAGLQVLEPEISNVSPYCSPMAPDGTWQGAARLYADQVMSQANPYSTRIDLFCPRDSFVSGFSGYTNVNGIQELTQLTLICHNVRTADRSGQGTPYQDGIPQTQWPERDCDPNSVAVGVVGVVNADAVVQFGLSCSLTQPAVIRANLTTKRSSVYLGPKVADTAPTLNTVPRSAHEAPGVVAWLPAAPVDVAFAAQAQHVTVSWRLPPGADPTRIRQYVIEERPATVGTGWWHPVGALAAGTAPAYLAHVNRVAVGVSLMRVCAEAAAGRACSGDTQVSGGPTRPYTAIPR